MGDVVSRRWIEGRLAWLAREAWGTNARCGDPASLLALGDLIIPRDEAGIAQVLGRLYSHARRWAPGLETSFGTPRVSVNPHIAAAGQYGVGSAAGSTSRSPPASSADPAACLAALCHEACHHILDLSGKASRTTVVDEPTTGLAMFVCGFGEVFLQGQSRLLRTHAGWRQLHLGYLGPEDYEFVHEWVLGARSLRRGRPGDRRRQAPEWRAAGLVRLRPAVATSGERRVGAAFRLPTRPRSSRGASWGGFSAAPRSLSA